MTDRSHDAIRVRGARQNSLRDVDVDVPKRRLVVVTGVSGSGKSSLVFDTIAAESARQLNETFSAFAQGRLPSYAHPDVDELENLSAVIVVDQQRLTGGPRSTVGTISDIGARLRLLFSRLGVPAAGSSYAYSFNDPSGMCPNCQGLGVASRVVEDELVDGDRSLAEGAITFPTLKPGTWLWKAYAHSGFFDPEKKVRDYSPTERELLLHARAGKHTPPAGMDAVGTTYEGLVTRFERLYLHREPSSYKGAQRAAFERIVVRGSCPTCGGTRLAEAARASLVGGVSIADCNAMQISDLLTWASTVDGAGVTPLLANLRVHLERMVTLGLGYLSLDRATSTLSGGEAQRIKMVRHLGSALADMLYVFDEPTVGLHPRDVAALGDMLVALRDRGNTVLVVEHDPDIMAIADHLIDLGPGAGAAGGCIVYEGDYAGLTGADTPTGRGLREHRRIERTRREPTGWIEIHDATTHNLRHVDARVPRGVMTVVTGVAGSGKSSLILGSLPDLVPDAVVIDQRPIRGSRRSNPATFTGLLNLVRDSFAKSTGQPPGLFTPNSTGGCPACEGNGVIYTDLAFMDGVLTPCEECGGRRFTPEAQSHTIDGVSIADVFEMSVTRALDHFTAKPILRILERLRDVGLEYVALGQVLTTLSGGEQQRLKLAAELGRAGRDGGRLVFAGTPEEMVANGRTHTAEYLRRHLGVPA